MRGEEKAIAVTQSFARRPEGLFQKKRLRDPDLAAPRLVVMPARARECHRRDRPRDPLASELGV